MKSLAAKILLLLVHHVTFTWHDSTPGTVIIKCGSVPGGPYTFNACRSTGEKCSSRKFTAGGVYYCVAAEIGVNGVSNEVSFTSK
jgi:hypothetical protein